MVMVLNAALKSSRTRHPTRPSSAARNRSFCMRRWVVSGICHGDSGSSQCSCIVLKNFDKER